MEQVQEKQCLECRHYPVCETRKKLASFVAGRKDVIADPDETDKVKGERMESAASAFDLAMGSHCRFMAKRIPEPILN